MYAPEVRPWFEGVPSAAFAKYATESGLEAIQERQVECREGLERIRRIIRFNANEGLLHRFEEEFSQAEREDVVLRTFKREREKAEKHSMNSSRDDCPELTLARMSTGTNFKLLLASLFPPAGSSLPYNLVRSPGGVWERLQDPEDAPGYSSMTGLTAGQRAWIEDGVTRRHLALLTFCADILLTLMGVSEDILSKSTLARGPHVSQEGKKFNCCQRCKEKVDRHHYYCSRRRLEEAAQGHLRPPLADVQDVVSAAARRRDLEEQRSLVLEGMRLYPRAIFFTRLESHDSNLYTAWDVPNFVRPFRPTLALLKEIRDRAFETRDAISIGLLCSFVRRALPYAGGERSGVTEAHGYQLLGEVFDVTEQELRGMEKAAERELEQREEYELVKSCFEQLKTGKPDTSHPDLTIPTSALFLFDCLERRPTTFYAHNMPPDLAPEDEDGDNGGRPFPGAIGTRLMEYITPYEPTLAAARTLAYRVLEAGARDRLDAGMLHLLFIAQSIVELRKGIAGGEVPLPANTNPCGMFDRLFGEAFGATQMDVAETRRQARGRLEELRGKEEWKLIVGAIDQFERQVDGIESYYDDHDGIDAAIKCARANLKRNKKKKEKGKKAPEVAADDEEAWTDAE
ncbi:hypothetical protein JCM6882_009425 [Rhodosporidiobolus microsporus]